ncbi:uncharacterized protein [Chironomus tepperi]|uniref:uncharacterized protein n=1 Tax=Chironomus tepperi TaxID=113505 RepID=UPI00391F2E53
MIPTNKLKKLVLQNIVKFVDSETTQDIWNNVSNEIHATTEESSLNSLQVKEIFYKEILPDLSYNNFGYNNEIVERLKSLKTTADNNSDGTSSIDWMEIDKMPNGIVEEEHVDEVTEDQSISTDNESEGDVVVNAILAKYHIDGHVRATQEVVFSQETEQMYMFQESQLINIYGAAESDPLANSFNAENTKENNECEGRTSVGTENRRTSLKRRSNSLSDINSATNFDQNDSELQSKRSKSNSLDENRIASLSDSATNQFEVERIVNSHEKFGSILVEKSVLKESSNKEACENSNNIENDETKKSADDIVAEIQKRLNEAKSSDEILAILEENDEYLSMLEIPFHMPDTIVNNVPEIIVTDEPEIIEEQKEISSESIKQPEEEPARSKCVRNLKNFRPKFNYDSPCSDSISQEESSSSLQHNDTILAGSHKICRGEVNSSSRVSKSRRSQSSTSTSAQPTNSLASQSESHSNTVNMEEEVNDEMIEKIQAMIDSAESPEEIDRILKENEPYRYYIALPFREPESLITTAKPSGKSKDEIVAEIQKQLDTTQNSDTINRILKENEEYLEDLEIPFSWPSFIQSSCKSTQENSPQKVKQEAPSVQKQALKVKVENNIPETANLDKTSSRTELSFLLSQNVNVRKKRKEGAVQLKKVNENAFVDLTDDD